MAEQTDFTPQQAIAQLKRTVDLLSAIEQVQTILSSGSNAETLAKIDSVFNVVTNIRMSAEEVYRRFLSSENDEGKTSEQTFTPAEMDLLLQSKALFENPKVVNSIVEHVKKAQLFFMLDGGSVASSPFSAILNTLNQFPEMNLPSKDSDGSTQNGDTE